MFNNHKQPLLVHHHKFSKTDTPTISIVVPVFNQSSHIRENLLLILKSTENLFELIVIDDASTDGTSEQISELLADLKVINNSTITDFFVYRYHKSVFETRCDDFGIRNSRTNLVIEIQADMSVYERGYDQKLVDALTKFDDLLMISGRGTEPIGPVCEDYKTTLGCVGTSGSSLPVYILLSLIGKVKQLIKPKWLTRTNKIMEWHTSDNSETDNYLDFGNTGRAGRLGNQIDILPTEDDLVNHRIYIGQTVMRGPLILNRSKYLRLNGFNCEAFFLGFDDHDLCIRGYLDFQFRVGFTPVGFSSPLTLGSTRKKRRIRDEIGMITNLLRINNARKCSKLFSLSESLSKLMPSPEVREF